MHDHVPTNKNLMMTSCNITLMCNLCLRNIENLFQIFFECPFAIKLCSWFANSINMILQFSYMDDIWKFCDMSWSLQCKVVIKAALINLLNIIWYVRNQTSFNNKNLIWRTTISIIIANTSLSGNGTSKTSNNSIRDFTILKLFKVNIQHPNARLIKEVFWQSPIQDQIK